MIKKIYQLADVHIPTYRNMEMYETQLGKLVSMIQEDVEKSNLTADEMRIVICGDLVNSKNTVTNELDIYTDSLILQLSQLCKVIVIAGNHDYNKDNGDRVDTLTKTFVTGRFDNAIFLDMALDYESGIMEDDNIVWVLYSTYDGFKGPDMQSVKEIYPDKTIIGLFHGSIVGCKLYNGFINDDGCDVSNFDGCNAVMAGHIHKRQVIEGNDCKIVYVGSTVQKDFGESITQHGYAIWDIETLKCDFVDIPSEYGYYDMTINSFDDFDNDKEILNNY